MIYKDSYAHLDNEDYPAVRIDDRCLNCGRECIGHHTGWACDYIPGAIAPTEYDFSKLTEWERYVTVTMARSIGINIWAPPFAKPTNLLSSPPPINFKTEVQKAIEGLFVSYDPPKAKPKIDETKWQAWAHNVPGECACGIPRERCDYHR